MSVPKPPFSLDGHCSAIHNNTLYVYTSSGFTSLPLEKDDKVKWKKEANGQTVKNPSCVKVTPKGNESQAALYVIGGETDQRGYGGLQRYVFATDSWETLPTAANVLAGRTSHGIAYLDDYESLLIYAGSQPTAPSVLSSQTFLMSTKAPYNIQAFTSTAPPTNSPILQSFNGSHAIMVGGQGVGTGVYLWSTTGGWSRFGTNLTQPLNSAIRGTVIDGKDRSKVLQLYDVSTSPNVVSSVVLEQVGGAPARTGQTVGTNSTRPPSRRDLSLDSWPAYNSTSAPRATRTDCSVAEGDDGLSVIVGGNEQLPIALFNRNENSWIDPSDFFVSRQQEPLLPSITTSSVPAPTSSVPVSATTAPANNDAGAAPSGHNKTLRTLGITLGVLCGVAALFIILLLCLRRRKIKQKQMEGQSEKKGDNRLSFADRGASFMKEAGGSVNNLDLPPRNRYDSMGGSRSSLAIIAGKFGKRNTNGHAPKHSYESTTHLVKNNNGSSVTLEMVDLEKRLPNPHPAEMSTTSSMLGADMADKHIKEGRKRSSGWSKYFAANQPGTHLSHIPSVYVKPQRVSDGSRYSGELAPSAQSRAPSSAMVAPLDFKFDQTADGQRVSHVAMGSPHISHSHSDMSRHGSLPGPGQKGQIVGGDSRVSAISGGSLSLYEGGDRSTLNSSMTDDFFAEHGDSWTPIGGVPAPTAPGNFKDHLNGRPPSSTSASVTYEVDQGARVPSRGRSAGFFPGAGTSYRPQSRPRTSASTGASGVVSPIQATFPTGGISNGLMTPQRTEGRESTLTIFPSAASFESPPPKQTTAAPQMTVAKSTTNDISWVNLAEK